MKTLARLCCACLCCAVFSPLQLIAQEAPALRKQRDKLDERGLWREALTLYQKKLRPLSDDKSGADLAHALEAVKRLNAIVEFDGLVEGAVAAHPDNPSNSTLDLARFSQSQFGTETLASYGWWREQDPDTAKGILEMDTLAEDECLAKTSDGVHRFKLPASHHFIALYRSLLKDIDYAGDALTREFLNRRQFDKAREVLEKTIAAHGPGTDNGRKLLLQQITGNWGRFEPAATVPAGVKPTLPLVFRNASRITLTAAPVDMEAVLKDTIDYLKSNPGKIDWQRLNPSQIASRLIQQKQSKFTGKTAAAWEAQLTPNEKHRDTRATLEVPLAQSGAWWITAKLTGGNEFHTLVWIVDSVLVQHDVAGQLQWWVADAASGAPVNAADIQFFGYRLIEHDRKLPLGRRQDVQWREFQRVTDADGKTLLKPGAWDPDCQWLAIARGKDRSPAFFGFRDYHTTNPATDNGNRDLSYGISDRPLYKPGDPVHLKFYLRNLGYFEPDESKWANKPGTLTLCNGRCEEVVKIENLKTDALGSIETEVIIPKNAALGAWRADYQINDTTYATVSFRVEEFRKPEYEVTVEAPAEPVKLGDMFIEAVTVHGAQVHTAVRQILLPPVSKLIEVTLEPAKPKVKPKDQSSLRITLRDAAGLPVTGTAVLTLYDKSLEVITGGSNVGPIHENFWKWRNNYDGNSGSNSLPDCPGNLVSPNVIGMESLGPFEEPARLPQCLAMEGVGYGGGSGKMFGAMADGAAMPMAAPAMGMLSAEVTNGLRSGDQALNRNSIDAILNNPNRDPAAPPIRVRKDFADLLKWSGAILTDADGHADIPLEFPDNLTTWKARVWTLGKGTQVGEGSTEIVTSKDLLVRLQAPRFLVERDEAVLSAVVHNDCDTPKSVNVSLELEGQALEAIDGAAKTVDIAARRDARVDWRVKALHEGEATLRMRAESGDDGDAVERKLPVLVHGMLRQDAWSRTVEPDQKSATILLEVPEQRRPDQSKLTVRFSPTIAGAVVDAILYLAGYPHGCTEQTLNRFVPGVIAQRMLRELNINLAEVKAKRTNLNPQELGDAAGRAAQWQQWQHNPVFDEAEITKMTAAGVDKLMSMQNSDGGWGWFSGYGESSYPHTTAVVVHGLLVAKTNGALIPAPMLDAGIAWLLAYERQQTAALQLYVEREALRKEGQKPKPTAKPEKPQCDATDAFVRMVLGEGQRDCEPMLAFLYRDRRDLPVYAKCLLGLEHLRKGDDARRDELLQMISQFLKRDPENQTAWLDVQNTHCWWNWYGSEVEAHAWYLKLLAAVKPRDPDTRGLVKYLVNNRKHATYWESTRDTAYAIEAIAAYFKASGEDAPAMEVEISLDGKSLKKVAITRDNLFTFDGTVVLAGEAVTTGKHTVTLGKSGPGTLYANAYLEVFTLEDKLRAAGLEVKVQRRLSKLIATDKDTEVPDATGLIARQRVERFRREPLTDGAALASGDRLEVELVLESKNDYEYLVFADAKAAGCEALDALSGYVTGDDGFSAYMEPRDRTVDFFIRALPRGTHTLRYQLRAEAPGTYHALPATAAAMYAPELRANSDELILEIK